MSRKAGVVLAVFFLLTSNGLSQDNRFDFSLNGAAVFNKQSTGNGTVQTVTQSGAFLATARMRFTPMSSLELNYARTKNSQKYASGPNDYRIQDTITEFTGAYVFSFFQTDKLEPFLFGGGGVLVFNPSSTFVNSISTPLGAVRQTQFAALYGVGVDYKLFSGLPLISRSPLSEKLALRLQYRGLWYKAPSFKVQNLFTGAEGHMAEPSIGIALKF